MLEFLKINVKNDITAVRPLHSIATFIGLLPPIDLNKLNKFHARRIVPISILVAFLLLRALTTIGKLTYYYHFVGFTIQITDLSVDFSLAFCNAISFIETNVLKGNRVHSLLARLRSLDAEFRFFKGDSRYANAQFYLELVMIHLSYVLVIGMNLYLWMYSMGFAVYLHFLLRDIQHYFVLIQALLMRHYALLIKYRYELLNRVLAKLSPKESVYSVGEAPNKWCIRRVNELYAVLGEIVHEYNHVFGWQYFAMYINTLVTLLLPINLALAYGDGQRQMRGVHFGLQFIAVCLLFTTLRMLLSLGIFSGGGLVSEARRTATIAFDLLQHFPGGRRSRLARNELLELAQRATTQCPEITAAGFFTVNYRTLFSLYGSVTSYLIVLLQYNK